VHVTHDPLRTFTFQSNIIKNNYLFFFTRPTSIQKHEMIRAVDLLLDRRFKDEPLRQEWIDRLEKKDQESELVDEWILAEEWKTTFGSSFIMQNGRNVWLLIEYCQYDTSRFIGYADTPQHLTECAQILERQAPRHSIHSRQRARFTSSSSSSPWLATWTVYEMADTAQLMTLHHALAKSLVALKDVVVSWNDVYGASQLVHGHVHSTRNVLLRYPSLSSSLSSSAADIHLTFAYLKQRKAGTLSSSSSSSTSSSRRLPECFLIDFHRSSFTGMKVRRHFEPLITYDISNAQWSTWDQNKWLSSSPFVSPPTYEWSAHCPFDWPNIAYPLQCLDKPTNDAAINDTILLLLGDDDDEKQTEPRAVIVTSRRKFKRSLRIQSKIGSTNYYELTKQKALDRRFQKYRVGYAMETSVMALLDDESTMVYRVEEKTKDIYSISDLSKQTFLIYSLVSQ
jgi:hypothetical protein